MTASSRLPAAHVEHAKDAPVGWTPSRPQEADLIFAHRRKCRWRGTQVPACAHHRLEQDGNWTCVCFLIMSEGLAEEMSVLLFLCYNGSS